MTKYKIIMDEETCIGCGACTVCDNFVINDDNKAVVKESIIEEIGQNAEAKDVCPVDAIKIDEVK